MQIDLEESFEDRIAFAITQARQRYPDLQIDEKSRKNSLLGNRPTEKMVTLTF